MEYLNKSPLFEIQSDKPDFFTSFIHHTQNCYPHFHRNVELYCVIKGVVTVMIDDEKYEIEEGQAVFINSLKIHSYDFENADVSYTIMGTDFLEVFGVNYPGKEIPFLLLEKEKNSELFDFINYISRESGHYSQLEKHGYTNMILHMIISKYGTVDIRRKKSSSNFSILNVIQYIYENYTQKITLASIANHFHVHSQTVSNLLSKNMQTDLRNYINNLRIQQVLLLKELPENAKKTTIDIALQCGFNSSATFYRALNKYLSNNKN